MKIPKVVRVLAIASSLALGVGTAIAIPATVAPQSTVESASAHDNTVSLFATCSLDYKWVLHGTIANDYGLTETVTSSSDQNLIAAGSTIDANKTITGSEIVAAPVDETLTINSTWSDGYNRSDQGSITKADFTGSCAPPATHVTPVAPTYTPGTCSAVGTIVATNTAQYTWATSGTTAATIETASAVETVVLDGKTVYGPYDLSKLSGEACPTPPTTPAPITCTVTGAPYTESGDHPPVQNASGVDYRSYHDGHATGTVIPIHANAQGITSLSFTDTNVVGYGMFSRLIFNLSADGGPGYASFSVSPGNTIDQNAVAGVGSKNVLLGKTVAQVATAYPHNVIVGWAFQTGSTYPGDGKPSSDGGTLTGTSGDCGTVNNVPVKPAPVVVQSPTTTVVCASLTQTTITTTTTKPQIWDATATPPGYTVDTNSADWTVTSNSPGVTVALTSDQITKDCPSSTPTPTSSPTPSTSVPGGGTDGGDIVSSVHASSPVTPSNNGGLNLAALFIALMASVALFGGVVGGRRVLKLRTRSGQNN